MTKYDASIVERTINNSWNAYYEDDDDDDMWNVVSGLFAYLDNSGSSLVVSTVIDGTKTSTLSNVRRCDADNPRRFLYPSETVTDMTITVSGLTNDDVLTYNDGTTDHTLTNGTHTISITPSDTAGFTLARNGIEGDYVDDTDNIVQLIITNPYDPAAPKAASASLYCPSEWNDKITSDMVSAANAKGWSIYVGGSEA